MRTTQRKQERPLTFDLAVHPMALRPTSRNPQCLTHKRHWGMALQLAQDHGRDWFTSGSGLWSDKHRFVVCTTNGHILGYTDDPVYGLAWINAAKTHAFTTELHDVE
jgi:hypothetical protein